MNKHGALLSNGFWSLSTQIVRVGSLAAITIALSRYFGPQRFGALAVGFAFVRGFAVLATFGLDRIVVRHLVEQTDYSNSIVRETLRLKLVIAIVSYLAMIGFVWTLSPGDRLVLWIGVLAGAGLLLQSCDAYEYAFQAQNQFGVVFLGRAVPILISTALKGTAIFLKAPLLVFAFLETVEAAFIAGALTWLYKRAHTERVLAPAPVRLPWTRLIAEGFPLLLSALAVVIYMRSDVIMLGKIVGYKAAGIYAAASQISEACALLPMAIMPALFPILVRWRRNGLEFYSRRYEKLFLVSALSGLSISLTLAIAAPFLVPLIFGTAYVSAVRVLRILAWMPMFVFIGVIQGGYDITEGLTWLATLRVTLGATINIGVNLILIPRYGPVGAAIATVISQCCAAILLNGLHCRTRRVLLMQLRAFSFGQLFRHEAFPSVLDEKYRVERAGAGT